MNKLKKCTFFRTIYDTKVRNAKAVKTNGFYENLTDKNGNEITLCFHKEAEKVWIVTEKSTGFRVCEGDTRMKALEEVKKKYLDLIFEKIKTAEKYKSIIARAYAEE